MSHSRYFTRNQVCLYHSWWGKSISISTHLSYSLFWASNSEYSYCLETCKCSISDNCFIVQFSAENCIEPKQSGLCVYLKEQKKTTTYFSTNLYLPRWGKTQLSWIKKPSTVVFKDLTSSTCKTASLWHFLRCHLGSAPATPWGTEISREWGTAQHLKVALPGLTSKETGNKITKYLDTKLCLWVQEAAGVWGYLLDL